METEKIIDKKTGAIKEVKKSLVGDFVGTGKFEVYVENKKEVSSNPFSNKYSKKIDKEEK